MLEFRRVLLCPLEGPRMKASPDTISILNTQTVVLKYHVLLNDRIQNHTDSCQRVFGFICKLREYKEELTEVIRSTQPAKYKIKRNYRSNSSGPTDECFSTYFFTCPKEPF